MTTRFPPEYLWHESDDPELLDVRGAVRDTFLAGGYTGAMTGAVIGSWQAAAVGFGGGGFIGFVLHFVPRNFERGSRGSRVALRALSGAIAGAGSGSSVQRFIVGDTDPEAIRGATIRGAIAGATFYALWGLMEPRSRKHPARQIAE